MCQRLSCGRDDFQGVLGDAGVAVLCLGKLCSPMDELFVIEVSSPTSTASTPSSSSTATASSSNAPSHPHSRILEPVDLLEEHCNRHILENDLQVEDFSSDDHSRFNDVVDCLPPPWAPGSAMGRKLMTARAKQCVVCLTDKEHTLVPPHRQNTQNVEGHRFCTDCWAEFLQHQIQTRGNHGPACPVCRGPIDVPDVWCVGFPIPDSWFGPTKQIASVVPPWASLASTEGFLAWHRQTPDAPEFWADVASSAHSSDLCDRSRDRATGFLRGQPSGSDASHWRCTLRGSMDRCVRNLNRYLSSRVQIPFGRIAVAGHPAVASP
jgi:hypothetical protein